MAGTNLKEFDENGNKIDYSNLKGFRDAVDMPSASAQTLIIRCVSINNRKLLNAYFNQMGINVNTTSMQVVHSDDEWKIASNNGKKTYLICSMSNFMLIGSNGWSYSSGPVHRDELIYKDTRNNSNAIIVIDHVLNFKPVLKEDQNVATSYKQPVEEDDNYMYHPKAIKDKANIQLPVYNEVNHRHELKCDKCGMYFDEKQVSSFYSASKGYTYLCNDCSNYKSPLKKLTYRQQLAKASGCEEEDNYSFDGN